MAIYELDLSEESIRSEIRIDNSSIFAIERELAEHPNKEAKYIRYAAMANKEVARLSLELEVIIAEIVDEIKKGAEEKGKPIPPSAVGELRKTSVQLDRRFVKTKKKLYEAQEVAEILNGLVRSWYGRGFRLDKIAKLNEQDRIRNYFDDNFNNSLEEKLDYGGDDD